MLVQGLVQGGLAVATQASKRFQFPSNGWLLAMPMQVYDLCP